MGAVDSAVEDGDRHALAGHAEPGDGQRRAELVGGNELGGLRPRLGRVGSEGGDRLGVEVAQRLIGEHPFDAVEAAQGVEPDGRDPQRRHREVPGGPHARAETGQTAEEVRRGGPVEAHHGVDEAVTAGQRRQPGRHLGQAGRGPAPAAARPPEQWGGVRHHRQGGCSDEGNGQETEDAAHRRPSREWRQDRFPHDPGI